MTTPTLSADSSASRKPLRRRRAAVVSIILGIALVAWLSLLGEHLGSDLRAASTRLLILALVCAVVIAAVTPGGVWSSTFLYYVVIALFHCGLFLTPAFTGDLGDFLRSGWLGWYSPELMIRAGYLVELGLIATAFGAAVAVALPQRDRVTNGQLREQVQRETLADVGGILAAGGVILWYAVNAQRLGPFFFVGSYIEYVDSASSDNLVLANVAITLGTVLVVLAPKRFLPALGGTAVILFAAMSLLLGARGVALIPILAGVAVFARIRKPPSPLVLITGIVVVLAGISLVQQVRVVGVANDHDEVAVSITAAIEEMGYSIRVVTTSVGWHEFASEPYRLGQTYAGQMSRLMEGLVGAGRLSADSDHRLMNVEIANRVGPIGGSIIAEAHHNFGPIGVPAILAMASILLTRVTMKRPSSASLALGGLVMTVLLMHVRNSFAPIFVWTVTGLLIILGGLLLASLRMQRTGAGA